MKIEKIKPIPKYIIELIKKRDKQEYPAQNGVTRYYDYLTKNDGELVKITVAVRNHYKKWYLSYIFCSRFINLKQIFLFFDPFLLKRLTTL